MLGIAASLAPRTLGKEIPIKVQSACLPMTQRPYLMRQASRPGLQEVTTNLERDSLDLPS